MSLLTGGRARWAALGAIVGAFAAGGIAYAAIPDQGGVFHACYKKTGGQLRLVNSASDCNSSETATQWNQTGPSGQSGPQGPGATWGTATIPRDATFHTVATTSGINLDGFCDLDGVTARLSPVNAGDVLNGSGTWNSFFATNPVDVEGVTTLSRSDDISVDLDVVVRDASGGNFVHIDLRGSVGCLFWWVIIPSSPESP